MPHTALALALIVFACCTQAFAQSPAQAQPAPVWIGFDDAYGLKTNTSAIAIEWGIKAAMEEMPHKQRH
jgi:branched-chain amino acid transport system substrate-binding protein